MPERQQRLLKFAEFLSSCTKEAKIYGQCVAKRAEKIQKDDCRVEFEHLINCFRRNRNKRAARSLTFFHYNFGYIHPYSILLDGTFCQAALQNKINLREQMPKYLADTQAEMLVTECVLNELEQLGKPLHGAHVIAQQFRIAKCPHRPMRTAAECIAHLARRSKKPRKDVVDSENSKGKTMKYFVATQDDSLLEKLRELGGIPLMSIRFNTILLEKPSDQSQMEAERKKPTELEKARQMKKMELGEDAGIKHRKRKAKGPNPLSCKKKKKLSSGNAKGRVPGAFGNQQKNVNNPPKQSKSSAKANSSVENIKKRKTKKWKMTKEIQNCSAIMEVENPNE